MSKHHSFDLALAQKYGVNEAIMIHHFMHWIDYNKALKRNQYEGRNWMYQSVEELAAHFPYWTKDQVREVIDKLCLGKSRRSKSKELEFEPVLITGNFNKNRYDRTIWYTFTDSFKSFWESDQNDLGKCQNGVGELPKPIPDTKTNTKTHKEREGAFAPARPILNESKEIGALSNPNRTSCSQITSDNVNYCTDNHELRINSKEKLYERAVHVNTTNQEHTSLLEKFGSEKVKRAYKCLSEWKQDKPRSKWRKNDYRSILRWVINALDEEDHNSKLINKTKSSNTVPETLIKKRRNDFMRFKEKYIDLFRKGTIVYNEDVISMGKIQVRFDSENFDQEVKEAFLRIKQ